MTPEESVAKLHWMGHDAFRLDGPPVIYIDPWKLQGKHIPADLVLISHDHYDHCSPEDVRKVMGPRTIVVATAAAEAKVPGARIVRAGERLTAAGVDIETVPAYNVNKFRSPGQPFHPREAGMVGYIVTVGGVRIYFAGDTDHIPEMDSVQCDIALLPVSGIYVMTAEEAAQAAKAIRPAIVVPMHYGLGIGTDDDGERFARLYDGKVTVLKQE